MFLQSSPLSSSVVRMEFGREVFHDGLEPLDASRLAQGEKVRCATPAFHRGRLGTEGVTCGGYHVWRGRALGRAAKANFSRARSRVCARARTLGQTFLRRLRLYGLCAHAVGSCAPSRAQAVELLMAVAFSVPLRCPLLAVRHLERCTQCRSA